MSGLMEESMMANVLIIKGMAKEYSAGLMVDVMKEISLKIRKRALVLWSFPMAESILENGKKINKTEKDLCI